LNENYNLEYQILVYLLLKQKKIFLKIGNLMLLNFMIMLNLIISPPLSSLLSSSPVLFPSYPLKRGGEEDRGRG
jgi:hypothetical protein